MKKIENIFIHHSASNFGYAKLIEQWHKERGWKGIGYHFVVLNGYRTGQDFKNSIIDEKQIGLIEKGRKLNADPWLQADEIGAHAYGYNSNSIGICLIHEDIKYNPKQLESYRDFTAGLVNLFDIKIENIKGHYEVDPKKPLCPSLDMETERKIISEKINWAKTCYMDFVRGFLK